MRISMIVAMDADGCIGKGGQVPWRLKRDMKHFREVTEGHAVIMGRKTWDSIPEKHRPLPRRTNIVLTRNKDFEEEGAVVCHSVDEALAGLGVDEVFVIGGGEIYDLFQDVADRLIVTHVHTIVEDGDVFFPIATWGEAKDNEGVDFDCKSGPGNEYDFQVITYAD